MSRKTIAAKAIFAATAVAASAFGMSPALAAGEVVTSAGPVAVPTGSIQTITIKGTGFTSAITGVNFISPVPATCTATEVVVVSSTTLYAKTPNGGCTSPGKQTVTLTGTGVASTIFNPTDAKKTVTFVTPVSGTADFNGATAGVDQTGVAGSLISVTGLSGLASKGVSATLGGKAVGSVKVVDGVLTGKAPAGVAPGAADLIVKSGGVNSAAKTGFTYASSIKVKPAVFTKGATAPLVTISGLGFKPTAVSDVVVTFCGVEGTISTSKPYTDKAIYVTPPDFTAAAAATASHLGDVDATAGGVCVAQVTVDSNIDGDEDHTTVPTYAAGPPEVLASPVLHTSVITAGSTFTYAAY